MVDASPRWSRTGSVTSGRGQQALRTGTRRCLMDVINAGDVQGAAAGRIVLPASFTGGSRHTVTKLNGAMSYVRELGGGDLFITVTCNPLWLEILETLQRLYSGQQPSDHPEVVSQVFGQKLRGLLHLLRNNAVFGRVRAYISSIEWQKRGLPHAHIMLWPSRLGSLTRSLILPTPSSPARWCAVPVVPTGLRRPVWWMAYAARRIQRTSLPSPKSATPATPSTVDAARPMATHGAASWPSRWPYHGRQQMGCAIQSTPQPQPELHLNVETITNASPA